MPQALLSSRTVLWAAALAAIFITGAFGASSPVGTGGSGPMGSGGSGGTDIFRIGGYVTGHEEAEGDFLGRYGPSLRDYLIEALPGWSFELVALNVSSVYNVTDDQEVDFLFTDPVTFVCLSTEYNLLNMATRANLMLKYESNYQASAIVARANAKDINSLSDLRGKRIATAAFNTLPDLFAPQRALADVGVRLFVDTKQVIVTHQHMLGPNHALTMLLRDDADAAFLPAGSLEILAANGAIRAEDFKVLDPRPLEGYRAALVSTDSYPEWPLSALNHVTNAVKKAVAKALFSLPSRSHYTDAGRYYSWITPMSYGTVQRLLEETGHLIGVGARSCTRSQSFYGNVICPPGSYKLTEADFMDACADSGVPCPAGECACRPCRDLPARPVDIFAVYGAPNGTGGACSKMSVCASAIQRATFSFRIVDLMFEMRRSSCVPGVSPSFFRYKYRGQADLSLGDWISGKNDCNESTLISFEAPVIGNHLVEVEVGDQTVPQSPFVVNVLPPECGLLMVPTIEGLCVCMPGTVGIATGCLRWRSWSMLLIAVAVIALFGSVLTYAMSYVRNAAENSWRIAMDEISLSNPVEIIGRGTYGLVLKGTYRGSQVALKRMLPKSMRTSRQVSVFDLSFDPLRSGGPPRPASGSSGGSSVKSGASSGSSGLMAMLGLHDDTRIDDARKNDAIAACRMQANAASLQAAQAIGASSKSPLAVLISTGALDAAIGSRTHGSQGSQQPESVAGGPVTPLPPVAMGASATPSSVPAVTASPDSVVAPTSVAATTPATTPADAPIPILTPPQSTGASRPPPSRSSTPGAMPGLSTVTSAFSGNSGSGGGGRLARVLKLGAIGENKVVDPVPIRSMPRTWIAAAVEKRPWLRSTLRIIVRTLGFLLRMARKPVRWLFATSIGQRVADTIQDLAEAASTSLGFSFGSVPVSGTRRLTVMRNEFINEIRLVVHLRHQSIIMCFGAVIEARKEPLLVMEFMERGSLYDLLHNTTMQLDADILIPVIDDIVKGMSYLHLAKPAVLHNDLKSINILIDSSFRAKVSDFGLSTKRSSTGLLGTPFWMAPELLIGGKPTTQSDVYAFGITLFEIITRREPFEGEPGVEVLLAVADTKRAVPKRPTVSRDECPEFFLEIMTSCWDPDPEKRPTFQAIADKLKTIDTRAVASSLLARAEDRNRAHSLVQRVFPPRVAAALKEGRPVVAEEYDVVTILFSDIVGFTDLSSELPASAVMDMLSRLYEKFDQLTALFGLFKVETIGDAYMVVGGLPDPQEDHCARVAQFALEMVSAAASIPIMESQPERGNIRIRSGPVVASVVGKINPRYCLFGDTVNTAARMESSSVAGKVNLSISSCLLLEEQAPYLAVQSRGRTAIKGKGEMETFFLLPAKPETPYPTLPSIVNSQAGPDAHMRTLFTRSGSVTSVDHGAQSPTARPSSFGSSQAGTPGAYASPAQGPLASPRAHSIEAPAPVRTGTHSPLARASFDTRSLTGHRDPE